MSMTERQKVVKHFQDQKRTFNDTVDLAVYLKRDQMQGKQLSKESEYVEKVLAAGYKSSMMTTLMDDINSKTPAKSE